MIKKLFISILIVVSFSLFLIATQEYLADEGLLISLSPKGAEESSAAVGATAKSFTFADMVNKDLDNLEKDKESLPPEWKYIQYVSYTFHSDIAKRIIGANPIKTPLVPVGPYRLEIEFIDVAEEGDPGLILQMSLFEISSKNKIWELGRTYPIKKFIDAIHAHDEEQRVRQEQESAKNQPAEQAPQQASPPIKPSSPSAPSANQ